MALASLRPPAAALRLHPFLRENVHIRASANGSRFSLWQTKKLPAGNHTTGMQIVAVSGYGLKSICNSLNVGHVAPDAGGQTFLTGTAGVSTQTACP